MSRGKRYNGEKKLNLKKVSAVAIAAIVIILFIVAIRNIIKADKATIAGKNIELNYFTILTNDNFGVINSSGEVVIEAAYSEMIEMPNKAKPVFICTNMGTDETKAVNEKNQEIFTDYEKIAVIQNYDEKLNYWNEENLLKVQKEGKFGLINLDGTEILACEYDSITPIKNIRNSIIIKKDSQAGLVDSNGKTIIPVGYADITALTTNYEDGYIVKNQESQVGVVKADGQIVLECKYADVKNIVDNNKYIVKEGSTWKVIATDGTTSLDGKVGNAVSMNNGNVIINNNGKFSVINPEGNDLIPAEYSDLAYLFDDKYIAKKDDKYGIINIANDTVVEFKYTAIEYNPATEYVKAKNENGTYDYMAKDLAVKFTAGDETMLNGFISIKTQDGIKYYNYKLDEKTNKDVYTSNTLFTFKQNGKYGFIDKDGKTIVEPIYDDATEQNDYGYSAIKKDGKWGAIDQFGKIVIEPRYTLNENKVIDFIGKWHITKTNANFYTDADE